jgi:hypothetical protein
LAELSGELVPHSNIVKSFQFYSARQHADQALPDAHKPYFVVLLIATIAMLCDLYRPPPLIGSTVEAASDSKAAVSRPAVPALRVANPPWQNLRSDRSVGGFRISAAATSTSTATMRSIAVAPTSR